MTASFSAGGSHIITATYSGDTNYSQSSAPAFNDIAFFPTTTTISANTLNPAAGASVILTAFVDTSVKDVPFTGSVVFCGHLYVDPLPGTLSNVTLTPGDGRERKRGPADSL